MIRNRENPSRSIKLPSIEQGILNYAGLEAGFSVVRSDLPGPTLDIYGDPDAFTCTVTDAGRYEIRQIPSLEPLRRADHRSGLVLGLPHTLGLSSASIATDGGDVHLRAIRASELSVIAGARRNQVVGTIHASGIFAVRGTIESVNPNPDTVTIMDSNFSQLTVTAPVGSLYVDGSYAEQWVVRTPLAGSGPGSAPQQETLQGALNSFINKLYA